jgi:hypothetical protein
MFSIFVHPIIVHPDYSIITINPDDGVLRIRDSLTAVTTMETRKTSERDIDLTPSILMNN